MSRALALVDSSDESPKTGKASASNPVLETKLFAPRARSALVARPRLTEALRQAEAQKLTLIMAPAGFGKTTLLSAWLAQIANGSDSVAWISLDASENELAMFLAYVVKALHKACPAVGAHALELLQSPHSGFIDILTSLINDVNAVDAELTLVLDDYHVIDAAPVHAALTFLVDHLPARMRLVIASRSEPPLPLARLRARGELTEIRADDLRFTPNEASAFLHDVMGLDVSAKDTATLEQRTEGWITGLKLAALSMKGRDDTRQFVDDFSGDNRYIADYLVEEVLRSEPERLRQFLLATSVLDRMSGALCDVVTGAREGESQELLEDLERRNLFVVALDDRREWYRYHHLFADVLQRQSLRKHPEAARSAHSRASAWHEQHGSSVDAIRHALAAEDAARAAELLERNWPEKDRSYEAARWLERVKSLPVDIVRSRPMLSMGFAWGLLNGGELEAAEPHLRSVEQWLEQNGHDPRIATLSTELAAARVYLTQSLGNAPPSLEQAKRALELTPEEDHTARATGLALVALAHWGRGELDDAHRTFSEALDAMRTAGHEFDVIRGMFVLGDIRAGQGRLREAARAYENGLRVARGDARFASAETDELYLGLSEVHREWNELTPAAKHLESISRSADNAAHKGNRQRWLIATARIREAYGDFVGALELLDEAEKYERRDPVPRVRPLPALRARVWVALGRLDDAARWASNAKLGVDDHLSFLREFEHITLARILIARSLNDAIALLDRLAIAAESGGRMGSLIEILVLQSLAQQSLGNQRRALDSLAKALMLAEREGFVRVFLDEGNRMRDLLRVLVARGLAGDHARRVLAAFDAPKPQVAAPPASATGLVQPLTTREHEILRLIASGLRNQEIANRLSISAATVKRHVANAYAKLGVGHRTEALVRATELKLL